MRNFTLLLSIFIATYAYSNAQITVNNSTFPVSGDTLNTSTILTVTGLTIAKDGISKVWDLSALKASTINTTAILKAKDGKAAASFPTANLVEKSNTGNEYYIKSTATSYEIVGYAGLDPTGFGVAASTQVNPSSISRRSPMNFFDVNNTKSAINVAIPLTQLPDSIKAQIGAFASLIDSLRLKFATSRTDVVDGYGTIKVPMGDYEVLRERRLQYTDKKLEVYNKIFKSWSDISSLIPVNQLPAGVKKLVGTDTSFQYHFFNNKQKEVIAIATMDNADNSKVTSVTYKNIKKLTSTSDDLDNFVLRPEVRAYPNPANDEINVEMSNFNSGNYILKIYNLLGSVMLQEIYTLSGTKTFKLDISNLRKGTYLYSVSDSKGKIIMTKRLVVLKA